MQHEERNVHLHLYNLHFTLVQRKECPLTQITALLTFLHSLRCCASRRCIERLYMSSLQWAILMTALVCRRQTGVFVFSE